MSEELYVKGGHNMGCDCIGKLLGWVKPHEVTYALRELGYSDIISKIEDPRKDWLRSEFLEKYPDYKIELNPSYPKSDYHETVSGFITFNAFGEDRMIHYYYCNECNFEDLVDFPENRGVDKNDIKSMELTSLSLGTWGHSTEIMKGILKILGGGYIDENDCDDVPLYFIIPERDVRREK